MDAAEVLVEELTKEVWGMRLLIAEVVEYLDFRGDRATLEDLNMLKTKIFKFYKEKIERDQKEVKSLWPASFMSDYN